MPDFKSRQKRGKNQNVDSRHKSPNAEGKGKGPDPEAAHSLFGGKSSEEMFERHASLLGDHRMSQPANASQRADIVRQIQRDYGNSYVQRLVDHISSRPSGNIQAKLEVGPAGDKYELEADRIAKEVVRETERQVEGVKLTGDEAAQRAPSESSSNGGQGISDFERLVGAMGIMVNAFNQGAWRSDFGGNIDPSMFLISKLLSSLGSQKQLGTADKAMYDAVGQFARLGISIQSQAKSQGKVSGAASDLQNVLKLVNSSSDLLDGAGKRSLMGWLPKDVKLPPADAMFAGPSIKPNSESIPDNGADNYNNVDLADNYNNMPEDPSANYNNVDLDDNYNNIPNLPENGKKEESPYGVPIFVDDKKKEESPYGVPIFVDDKDEEEKRGPMIGDHRNGKKKK